MCQTLQYITPSTETMPGTVTEFQSVITFEEQPDGEKIMKRNMHVK